MSFLFHTKEMDPEVLRDDYVTNIDPSNFVY